MAFRRFGKYYRRRGVRRGAKRTGLRRKTVSKSVKRYVKRQIHKNIENKEWLSYGANNSITATTTSTQSLGLLPALSQGTSSVGRVGNSIRVVHGKIKLHFNLKPYDVNSNPLVPPVWIRVLLVKSLRFKEQQATLNGTDLGQLFRGNATSLPQQNTMLDMSLPVNDDVFRVMYDRQFKIGVANAYVTGQISTGSYFDNSPMSKAVTINYSKHCKSVLKFDDNDANYYPQNNNLYLVFCVANADGTTNAYSPVEYHYTNHVKYEDA